MSDNGILDTISSDYDETESKIVLYIETLTGTAFEVIVSPIDTVLSVKHKIHHDEGIPVNQQHLLLGDKELKNSAYLEEEGITQGCTLKLVLGMRVGAISTRKASSQSDHLLWRDLRDFVESTRKDVMGKVPPGAKVTLLVYREGDVINLIKVVENHDGTYSSLGDYRKPISSRSRTHTRTDVERFVDDEVTISKVIELRHKMEELSVKRKNRRCKNESGASSNFFSAKPKTETLKLKKIGEPSRVGKASSSSSARSKVKQWLNSDFYDDLSIQVPQRPKEVKKWKASCESRGNYFVNKYYEMQNAPSTSSRRHVAELCSESSDEEENSIHFGTSEKFKTTPPIKRISFPNSIYNGDYLGASSSSTLEDGASSSRELNSTLVSAATHNTSIGDNTSKMFAEYYPDVPSTEFRQTLAHRQTRLEEPECSTNKELSLDATTVHETSSIAILEEEAESNVGNVEEPDFKPPTGPISVPSPDANTFTISQIPRERISTSTGASSSRNRIRVARIVLKDDQRPKTSPDKISREFCDFLFNEASSDDSNTSNKCYELFSSNEDSPKESTSKLRMKRTKYISASNSRLDKLSNVKTSSLSKNNSVYSWPRLSPKGQFCCDRHRYKVAKLDHLLGSSKEKPKKLNIDNRPLVNFDIKSEKPIKTELDEKLNPPSKADNFEHLPPIEPKKSNRVRCKKCNKKLNISTIYTCRCGGEFCSQHRYSEVHGCHYDYKTEGRKLIEQANPLVLASKLPKI